MAHALVVATRSQGLPGVKLELPGETGPATGEDAKESVRGWVNIPNTGALMSTKTTTHLNHPTGKKKRFQFGSPIQIVVPTGGKMGNIEIIRTN
jgi:hypothetical protein